MPIYEYQCEACGYRLEKLQKMSEDPLVDCPECRETKLRKLVSAAVFRLKGTGWYETDFKTGSKRNLVGDGKEEQNSKESASSTGSTGSASSNSTDKPSSSDKPSDKATSATAGSKKD